MNNDTIWFFKIYNHILCNSSEIYNLPIITTRFSNIYGPGQLNFSALIPDCILALLDIRDFIPRSNGKNKRDYLFVDDFTYRTTPTCFEPSSSSLVASNITSNSVDISWTPGANETSWQVQYDTAGFVPGTGTFAVTNNTSYSLTGLNAATSYDLYVVLHRCLYHYSKLKKLMVLHIVMF